jgi:hypothetical protein
MTLAVGAPAYLEALFNVARFGASRFGALNAGRAFISIGGVFLGDARQEAFDPGILQGSMTIADILDDTPNTLSFTAWNFEPRVGAEVIVTLGSKNNGTRLFAGYVLSTSQVYLAKPINRAFHVQCIDYTWRLMHRKAWAYYAAMSATAIVTDLLERFAPAVSPRFVQSGLPTLPEITITNEDLPSVFKRIAARVGAYFYVDEASALHFFATEPRQAPAPIVPTHRSLAAVEYQRDLSQVVTRVVSQGGGGNALVPLPAGATLIPVDVASWYRPEGGLVSIGPSRVAYTGLAGTSGAGSLVGPGIAPVSAPALSVVPQAGLPAGTFAYAYTFQSASGETKPSPLASATTSTVPTPTAPPVSGQSTTNGIAFYNGGGYRPGDTVEMGYTYSLHTSNYAGLYPESMGPLSPLTTRVAEVSPFWNSIGGEGNYWAYTLGITVTPSANPVVKQIVLWWRVNGGPWWHKDASFPNPNPTGYYYMETTSGGQARLGDPPVVGPAVGKIQVDNVAVGPAGVTARRLYRTTVNGAQLKLLTTFAGNAAVGAFLDATPDASLGANAPVSDTSLLQGTAGQVAPGETSIIVAGTGWADPGGGYAVIGNGRQTVRYTGVTATALTGIPAAGVGSIVAAVPYNSSITAAPMLTGVPAAGERAIKWAVPQGEPVNVLAIEDDDNAQVQLRAVLPGHSGVIEDFINDGRLSIGEATARARALLQVRALPQTTLRYTSRDVTTRSGATVTVDLPAPADVHDTLKVQRVTISDFNLSPRTGLPPTFSVEASSARFSFEDLLRQARPTP